MSESCGAQGLGDTGSPQDSCHWDTLQTCHGFKAPMCERLAHPCTQWTSVPNILTSLFLFKMRWLHSKIDLMNTFCSGNKIFINMSPCETNKLDVVPYICLLSFKVPDRGKGLNNACWWTDCFRWRFLFLLILLCCFLSWAKSIQIFLSVQK